MHLQQGVLFLFAQLFRVLVLPFKFTHRVQVMVSNLHLSSHVRDTLHVISGFVPVEHIREECVFLPE